MEQILKLKNNKEFAEGVVLGTGGKLSNKENVIPPKHQVLVEKVAASIIDKISENKDLDSVLETID